MAVCLLLRMLNQFFRISILILCQKIYLAEVITSATFMKRR